jgi:hypothetical protein
MLSSRPPHFTSTTPTVYSRRRVGVNLDPLTAGPIAIMQKLGVTQVRITLYWTVWIDTRDLDSDGIPDNVAAQAEFAAALAALDAAGIEPLIMVHSPPPSYATLADGIAQMPSFMAGLATAMPGRIWQIMNEVDDHPYWSNNGWFGDFDEATDPVDIATGFSRGVLYGQLLAPVYDAIKAADPTATVITGGTGFDPGNFWAGLMSVASSKCDAVCVHAYGEPLYIATSSRSNSAKAVIGGKPLWCTEWGSTFADDATQAASIGLVLADNDANNRFDRMYLYTLVEGAEDYHIAFTDGRLRHAAMLLRDRS